MQRPSDIGLELVRRRRALGMSQRKLGERVGVKQPQIARWEAGAYRTASLERVDAVAEALGLAADEAVAVAAEESAGYGTGTAVRPVRDLGEIAARLRKHSEELRGLGFVDIAVFGSFARGEQNPGSDVDLLIQVGEVRGLAYVHAANRAEEILGRHTDVARVELLKERLRDSVLGEAIRVWHA